MRIIQLLLLLIPAAFSYEVVVSSTDPKCMVGAAKESIEQVLETEIFSSLEGGRKLRGLQTNPWCSNCYQTNLSQTWFYICLYYKCFQRRELQEKNGLDEFKLLTKGANKAMKTISKLDVDCDTSSVSVQISKEL